ncbi:MAG TPA: type II toxin-antitoxin system VapC family toxin [Vicinamibacterales bacterium]|nr:type II toxin-antitoxin system VapC family toxin [Vicinamibacterales bacterium]
MILVDTSIWIDHGRRRDGQLVEWLSEGLVLGHPFVHGELACGEMPRRTEVLALLEQLPSATVVSHEEVLHFLDRHRLMGHGLGWIDLHLLASTLVSRATLATRDRRLARDADALGVLA